MKNLIKICSIKLKLLLMYLLCSRNMILPKQYTAKGWSINDVSIDCTEREIKLPMSFVNSPYAASYARDWSLVTLHRLQSHLLRACLQIIIRQDRFVMHALIHEANICVIYQLRWKLKLLNSVCFYIKKPRLK